MGPEPCRGAGPPTVALDDDLLVVLEEVAEEVLGADPEEIGGGMLEEGPREVLEVLEAP